MKPKIIYNDIAQRLSFALSLNGEFVNNTVYFFSSSNIETLKYLLLVLNSKLIDWYYRTLSVQLGMNAVRMFSIYVLQLPIPLPDNDTLSFEEDSDESIFNLYHLTEDEKNFFDSL